MLYIIHDEQVQCAVLNPQPIDPSSWATGTILRFKTLLRPLPVAIDFTILASMSGVAWHLEILGRSGGLSTGDGEPAVAARVLRRLKLDEEMLVMIREFCRGMQVAFDTGEVAASPRKRTGIRAA